MAQVSALLLLFLSILLPISQPFFPTHATLAADDPSPPLPSPRVPHGSNSAITPTMAIILACVISTFFLTCFISVYVHRCVHRQMMTLFSGHASLQSAWPWREEATTRGVDSRVIASFPTFVYSEVKELKIGECALECAICLNEFEDEETLQLLPKCWHVFHPDCIQSWLSSHVTCPVCRAELLSVLGQTSHQVPVLGQASVPDPDVPTVDDDEMVVHVQSPDEITADDSLPKGLPPRSTSRKERRLRVTFRKSLSTGHSLVLPVENCERFTLRLPDELRNRLVNSGLERARSCHVAFPRARSGRKGYRSTSNGGGYDRFDQDGRAHRWVFTATPPFFSRAGPSRRPILTGDSGSEAGSPPVGLLKTVTSPLNRLFRCPNVHKDVLVSDGKV